MRIGKYHLRRGVAQLRTLLDLKEDFDEVGATLLISNGAEFRSGNAWGLIFAIFIASIGLNVNSTAVVIGAMLISPLMGSIVGAGFSLGTHDIELLKRSVKNLLYAVIISIVTSTLFFLVTPTASEKSELLARTQPTIFDVLIAFFGGAAGIVASTRTSKGNAVPGVAIATALMPPLCTVGYGFAQLEFQFVIGALYLFSINAVFILISTYLFTRILGFKHKVDRNHLRDKLIHRTMTWGSLIFVIPSIVMAWYLHKKSQFENSANKFINTEFDLSTTLIAKKDIVFELKGSRISIYLFGDDLTAEQKAKIEESISHYPPIRDAKLFISTIKKDKFTMNDLEEHFVKRSEFAQLLKIEETKTVTSLKDHSEMLRFEIQKKFGGRVSGVELTDGNLRVNWNMRPTKNEIQKLELEAYRVLSSKEINFSHAVVIR